MDIHGSRASRAESDRDHIGVAVFFLAIAAYALSNAVIAFGYAWTHYGQAAAALVLVALLFDEVLALPLALAATAALMEGRGWSRWGAALYAWPALSLFVVLRTTGGSIGMLNRGFAELRELARGACGGRRAR